MLSLTLICCCAAAGQAATGPAARVPIAVTRSGVQVEYAAAPGPGALTVQAPFGVLHTPADPVAVVMTQAPLGQEWQADPSRLLGSGGLRLVESLARTGHLSELVELADHLAAADRGPELDELWLRVCESLEAWGALLDPVPAKVPYTDRTAWLWKETARQAAGRALLLGGRLAAELPRLALDADERRLPRSVLDDGLESRDPVLRRISALAAAKQGLDEPVFASRILWSSLRDGDAAARQGMAAAAARLIPEYADYFWYQALFRSSEGERITAAGHLARYGGSAALDYLAYALSAAGKVAPERYAFLDRDVQVVIDRRAPTLPLLAVGPGGDPCSGAAAYGISPDFQHFDHVSVVKVCKPSPALTESLVRALRQRTGEGAERGVAEWLRWYEESRRGATVP